MTISSGFGKIGVTRGETILIVKLILEKRRRVGKPTFIEFVDIEKAFDIM